MSYYEISEILDLQHLATTSTLHFTANAEEYQLLRGQLGGAIDRCSADANLVGSNNHNSLSMGNELDRSKKAAELKRRPQAPLPDILREAMQREAQALHGERLGRTNSGVEAVRQADTVGEQSEAPCIDLSGTIQGTRSQAVLNPIEDAVEKSSTTESLPDILLLDVNNAEDATVTSDLTLSEIPLDRISHSLPAGCANNRNTDPGAEVQSTTRMLEVISTERCSPDIYDLDIARYDKDPRHRQELDGTRTGDVHLLRQSLSCTDATPTGSTPENRTNRFVRSDERTSRSSRASSMILKLHNRKPQLNQDFFCRACKTRLTSSEVADGIQGLQRNSLKSVSIQGTARPHTTENGNGSLKDSKKEAYHPYSPRKVNLSPRSQRRRDMKARKTICRMNPDLDSFDIIPGWGDAPRKLIQWEETVPREIWSRTVKAVEDESENSVSSWLTTELDEAKWQVDFPVTAERLQQWLDCLEVDTANLMKGDGSGLDMPTTPSSICSVSTHSGAQPAVE